MAVQVYIPTGIVHTTSVDFTARQISKPVYLVQGDISLPVIAIELNKDGQAYSVPSNADINIRLNKKDGTYIYNTALGVDSSRTIAYFEVTEQTAVVAGDFDPEVEIVINDTLAGSSKFKLIIEQQAIQDGMIESSSEAKALIKQVGIAKGYAEDAETSATSAANSATSAATSATNASRSATSAINSATAAANSESETRRYAEVVSDNIDALNTVSSNIVSVNTVSANMNSVNMAADNISNIIAVNTNKTNIDIVANNIGDTSSVADSIDAVNTVSDNITDVSSVSANEQNINTVSSNITSVNTVSTNVNSVNTTANNISEINSTAENINDINSIAENLTSISEVSNNMADINSVVTNMTAIQSAEQNAQTASDKALVSEGYAAGTQNGTQVTSGTYFKNNSKYYSEMARGYMESAKAIAFEEIDTELSDASGNVVENRAIKRYIDQIAATKQDNIRSIEITLLLNNWDTNHQQSISVEDVSSNNIIMSFSDKVKCIAISTNLLVFEYLNTLPENDLVVNMLIM